MRIIRLTESDLHKIVKSAVYNVLKEGWNGIDDITEIDDLSKQARKNGFNYIAYHNSENNNLVFFDVRESGTHFGSLKAANDRSDIRGVTSYTKKYFLKIDNPYVIERDFDWEGEALLGLDGSDEDEEYKWWRENCDPHYYLSQNGFDEMVRDDNGEPLYGKKIQEMLNDKGYDCIVYKNQYEDEGNYSVAMFNPNNIKLAEITRDSNGNIIPLNRRFDTSTNDVRY